MFDKSQLPVITPEGQLHCKAHSQSVEELKIKVAFNGPELSLLCPKCPKKGLFEKVKKILTKTYSQYDTYLMSFEDVSKAPLKTNPAMPSSVDIINCRLEDIIIDNQAQGYMLKNLVYIPDKNILVACSSGRIVFWSIGEKFEIKNVVNFKEEIVWAKYIKVDEEKEYLMLGTDKGVYVCNIKDINTMNISAILKCENKITSIDWIPRHNKLVTAGGEHFLRVWSIDDFSCEYTIEVTIRNTLKRDPIFSANYLQEMDMLVIEDKSGITFINFDASNPDKAEKLVLESVKYFELADRSESGFCYLSKLNQFVLKMDLDHTYILDGETLEPQFECRKEKKIDQTCSETRYLANDDGTQILMNSYKKCRLMLLHDHKNCQSLELKGFIKEPGGFVIMPDQHRFAVGDKQSGTILIFRTNIKTSSEPPSFSIVDAESEPIEAIIAAKKRHLKAKAVKKDAAREILEQGPQSGKRMTRASKKTLEKEEKEEKEIDSDLEEKKKDKEDSRRRSTSKVKESRGKKKEKNEDKSRERSKDVEKKRQKKKK